MTQVAILKLLSSGKMSFRTCYQQYYDKMGSSLRATRSSNYEALCNHTLQCHSDAAMSFRTCFGISERYRMRQKKEGIQLNRTYSPTLPLLSI